MTAGLIESALGHARSARNVIYVTSSQSEAGATLDLAAGQATDAAKIVRAKGNEQIVFPNGGRIFFTSAGRGAVRGMVADSVFVPKSALFDESLLREVMPTMQGRHYPILSGY